jgi:hypothetical protein
MLYEMLTGRRAFAGDEIPDVLAAVVTAIRTGRCCQSASARASERRRLLQ